MPGSVLETAGVGGAGRTAMNKTKIAVPPKLTLLTTVRMETEKKDNTTYYTMYLHIYKYLTSMY